MTDGPISSNGCEVRPVGGRSDLKAFERLPRRLRRRQAGWVEPLKLIEGQLLKRHRHPFYDGGCGAEAEFFLARDRTGGVIGRIAAIVNHRYDAHVAERDGHNHSPGFFGFFDCVDSPAVASALIGAAKDWLRGQGRSEMLGPASPSETYDYGLLVEGFDRPHRFLSAHQPSYYAPLLEQAGLEKAKDLLSLTMDMHEPDTVELLERFFEFTDTAHDHLPGEIIVRAPDIKSFDAEVRTICGVFNEALGRLWSHCPISEQEFGHIAWSLRHIATPDALLIAEHHDEPVGVVMTVPDINEVIRHLKLRVSWLEPLELLCRAKLWRPKCVRTLVLGVKPGHERSLVVPAIVGRLGRSLMQRGVRYVDAHLVLEDNSSIMTPLLRYGFKPSRRYRIYRSAL